jgi:CheY-like chemotaxis protein
MEEGQGREPALSTATILIVEDEPLVLAMASEIAEAAGFQVRIASEARGALAALELHPEISILFSDVRMPGEMNGKEMARVAKDRWPSLKIILTSGHNPDGVSDVPLGSLFLTKPYRPEKLEELLHELSSQQTERA